MPACIDPRVCIAHFFSVVKRHNAQATRGNYPRNAPTQQMNNMEREMNGSVTYSFRFLPDKDHACNALQCRLQPEIQFYPYEFHYVNDCHARV